jgi:hypothetical protein
MLFRIIISNCVHYYYYYYYYYEHYWYQIFSGTYCNFQDGPAQGDRTYQRNLISHPNYMAT